MLRAYKLQSGILIEHDGHVYFRTGDWDTFINRDSLFDDTLLSISQLEPIADAPERMERELLPPIGSQEVWAAGVTYLRSKQARMEEAEEAGGGDFYDRVYDAPRPELFFKATPHRVVGSNQAVRIRNDSTWNVPEPELTLVITSNKKIVGYTIGNDMSSRSIEGENPLYLPQAKTYDQSCSIGPGIYITEKPLPRETPIRLTIERNRQHAFGGAITLQSMKRTEDELVNYLFAECSFPHGCLLMTGTGIIPEGAFTLQRGDVIRIAIEPIGVLVNTVQ